MKPIVNYGLSDSLIDSVKKAVEEALVGGQKKLDVDKDGKLEKTDFASLRAKKNTIDTKPKLKEEEQMDEAVKNFDVHPKHARKIAQHLNNVGIRTKTSANDDRGLANDDPGSVNITATHKDPAHLAIHIHRAVDAHAQDHALSARMRGQLRASGVEPKPKREEYEMMDEAPMKSGAQSRREVDSVMDKYGLGPKQKEAPKSNTRAVAGKSYGADYKDPEGEDETAADMKKPEPKRKSGPQGTMARRFNTKSYEKIKGKLKAQY